MQLRHHPKLTWNGVHTWPPALGGSYGPNTKFPSGEQGLLKDTSLHEPDRIGPTRLELHVECENHVFSGDLFSDDPTFLHQLNEKLRTLNGRPLQEIGSLEIDF